jgi:hypothetical protein
MLQGVFGAGCVAGGGVVGVVGVAAGGGVDVVIGAGLRSASIVSRNSTTTTATTAAIMTIIRLPTVRPPCFALSMRIVKGPFADEERRSQAVRAYSGRIFE